jgi:type IX secretion system PorP/SprF family membrane protein
MSFKRLIPILLFYTSLLRLHAQDIHFTQFTQSPIFLNPALTGNFDGDLRFSGNFKNQWFTIPVPYNSGTFAVDANFLNDMFIHGNCGIGLLGYMDESGDSRFRTMGTSLSFSFNKYIGRRYRAVLSFGINAGYVFKGINTESLRWDEQFNGDFYDAAINPTDPGLLARNNLHNFDWGFGMNYTTPFANGSYFSIGGSLQHINAAYQSFYAHSTNVILQKRPVVYANLQVKLSGKLYLRPELFYQWQDDKQELVASSLLRYVLREKSSEKLALIGGLYYRAGDALAPTFRIEYNPWTIGISYDFNSSSLSRISSYQGGIEISVIYIQKYRKKKYSFNSCPYLWM